MYPQTREAVWAPTWFGLNGCPFTRTWNRLKKKKLKLRFKFYQAAPGEKHTEGYLCFHSCENTFVCTSTHSFRMFKTWNCTQEKWELPISWFPKQTGGMWSGFITASLYSPHHLAEDESGWKDRWSRCLWQGLIWDAQQVSTSLFLFFFKAGSNPKILNPKPPRAQPTDSQGQNDYLRSSEMKWYTERPWEGKNHL